MKNTYSEMKDCGVAWIGDIPQTWKKGRIKYNYFLKGRIGWQGLKADEFIEDGPYYLVTGTDFENGRIAWDRCYHISEQRFIEAPEIHIRKGDLLITKDGTVGKVALIDSLPHKASLNSHLLIVRPTSKLYDNVFLFWIFQSSIFEKYCGLSQNGSIMASLSQEKMSNFSFPLPSLSEQTAIAAYLDEKCGTIDEIIAEAKASIEEYKAWKSSVIFEAVTKGLDPHAEMKDSGVEWIGRVPRHWDVVSLKRFYNYTHGVAVRVGPFGSALASGDIMADGIWVYNQRTVLDNNFMSNDTCVSEEKAEQLSSFRVYPGDILITTRGSIGKIAIVPSYAPQGILHPCIIRFRVNEDRLNKKLLRYIFNDTDMVKKQILYYSNSTTIDVLYSYTLKEIKIPLIPLDEQQQIIDSLDEKCAAINGIIAEKEALIADMEAYKKSLIFETVTGKRKVC